MLPDFHSGLLTPSVRDQAYSLAKKGYNAAEAQALTSISSLDARKLYLKQNLETTVNHVFEDSVVSFTNSYQMNQRGEIISLPDGTALSIDPEERGGLYQIGVHSAITSALAHQHQAILLYSPPGPVVFDTSPHNKFKDMIPYSIGQLSLMYADGDKVNNVVISISNEGNPWLAQIMPEIYEKALLHTSDIDQISYFITHPSATGKTIDDFLDMPFNSQDTIIFKNNKQTEFTLSQTLALVRQSLAGQLPQSSVVSSLLQDIDIEHITAHDIDRIYGTLTQGYMREKGINTLTLGGSCGGTEVTLDPLSEVLSNLSTSFRLLSQGKNGLVQMKDFREDPHLCRCAAASGPHFHCPGVDKRTKKECRHAIVVGEGITSCPACGAGKTC